MSVPHEIEAVAARFAVAGQLGSAERLGTGHINDSYVLTYRQGAAAARFVLQRINTAIFCEPALVMDNVRRVTAHIAQRMEAEGVADVGRRVLTLAPTHAGEPCGRDDVGDWWRMYRFVERTRVRQTAETPEHAYQAGRAFGEFQRLLVDLPGPRLHETISDFHNTSLRLDALERVARADPCHRVGAVRAEIEFIRARRSLAGALLELQQAGTIPERVVHNDAKIENVLLDDETGVGLCVVDLDTVMPGLAPHDFGDMVRSMVSPAAEDEADLTRVAVRMPVFEALARGYLEATERHAHGGGSAIIWCSRRS